MKKILCVIMILVAVIAMTTAPAAAEKEPSWDELMDMAAKAAWEYNEIYYNIHAYSMIDINQDGIPELILTPTSGNRGAAYPVLVYVDGVYRYLCDVHLAYNWSSYYLDSDGETSLVIDHYGGPATEQIHRVTRLSLREDGVYIKDYRFTELWHTDPSTDEWAMYSAYSEFTEWLSTDLDGQGELPDELEHQPEDEGALFFEWFERGRLPGAAPYASITIQEFDFDGENYSDKERIQYVIHELGKQFREQRNNNPNTGK